MKKLFISTIALLSSLALIGCGGTTSSENNSTNESTSENEAASTESTNPNEYKVTVVYEDGTPVEADSCMVQLCTSKACLTPGKVKEGGVYTYTPKTPNEYDVHILGLKEGYTFNPNIYHLTTEDKVTTVTLYKLNEATGEGTDTSPIAITKTGLYTANVLNSVYYSFTGEAGTYEIESWASQNSLVGTVYDPTLYYLGDAISNKSTTVEDGGEGKNFKYTFTLSAQGTIYFALGTNTGNYPPSQASYNFLISKK